MKKKIAILGSTGSIGKSLLQIINGDKKNYEIILLTGNRNYLDLYKQAKRYNVKNLIVTNIDSYIALKKKLNNNKINIYNNYNNFNQIFKKKIDYVMSSISGIDGLEPTLKIIKFTKKIAIANKESIICAWNLLHDEISKYKTQFIPVDSEHFSLWYALKNNSISNVEKIYLTASGGPLLKLTKLNSKNIKLSQALKHPTWKMGKKISIALKHPTWKMGKKISIDSCTMMNKVFEVIETKHLFNIPYSRISILTHPKSYIHAIIKFKDGLIKIIAHDTTMKIPIFNTINSNHRVAFKTKSLDIYKLNHLELKNINYDIFPLVKILKNLPEQFSLFETVIITVNDFLVNQFLKKRIKYNQINSLLLKFIKNKEFNKYKKIKPKKFEDIIFVKNKVSLKIISYFNK